MSSHRSLVTRPLVVFTPADKRFKAINLITGERYTAISIEMLRVLFKHLLADEGVDEQENEECKMVALFEGLVGYLPNDEFSGGDLWEVRNWTRAAYLLFSQSNINYLEKNASEATLTDLQNQRRQTIDQYRAESSYPPRRIRHGAVSTTLPTPSERLKVDLNALYGRRSCRSFARCEISNSSLSYVLFWATAEMRVAEEKKSSGDPLQILNSFYSWLEIYVVVQEVQGVRQGIYQYDPIRHELLLIRIDFEDADVTDTIQGQNWIGGSGFCLFFASHWQRYSWIYRHSRAYINLLIQVGEFAQEVLMAAYEIGMVGWMTPAVSESKAGQLLALDEGCEDAIYFMKLGLRSESPELSGQNTQLHR